MANISTKKLVDVFVMIDWEHEIFHVIYIEPTDFPCSADNREHSNKNSNSSSIPVTNSTQNPNEMHSSRAHSPHLPNAYTTQQCFRFLEELQGQLETSSVSVDRLR
jgi:hypothetical protein